MNMFYWADVNDPNEEPNALLFHSAQTGFIAGLERAVEKDPRVIYASEMYDRRSALHIAAASPEPAAVNAVRWLLDKGIPWSASDMESCIPEDLARENGNEESRKILQEWAIKKEYEVHYKRDRGEENPDDGKPFTIIRLDKDRRNEDYCKSNILFTNPNGAPHDEVALVCVPDGSGIMMEWERPIMRETARLLLKDMPKSGLRILNIGFGIGMIDTYFQDAKPAEHVIIEGHPTCLGWMRHNGWYDRPGVRILEGRWQDFFPPPESNTDTDPISNLINDSQALSLKESGSTKANSAWPIDIGKFDIVYFDTFEECYRGHFAFIKHVPRLLRGPTSRFSYFNGHAKKHETSYMIYAEVARLHHNDLGLNTEWSSVYIDKKEMWDNIRNRGKGDMEDFPYLIPICALAPTIPHTIVPGVGWKPHPIQVKPDNVDGTGIKSSSLVD